MIAESNHQRNLVSMLVHPQGEMRNKDQHGSNESKRTRIEREEVEHTLCDVYDLREHMEPGVQQVLCRDIADHFSKPPLWFNKNWLAVHGPLVKKVHGGACKEKSNSGSTINKADSISHYAGRQGFVRG